MLLVIDGRVYVLTACDECRRTARIRWPERWAKCDWCSVYVFAELVVGNG